MEGGEKNAEEYKGKDRRKIKEQGERREIGGRINRKKKIDEKRDNEGRRKGKNLGIKERKE